MTDKERLILIESLATIEDYGDYKTATIDFHDFSWIMELAENVEELSKFKKDAETLFQRQKLGFANLAEKIERYEKALNDIAKELNRYCSEGWTTKALEIANKSLEG
jgi:TPP-dependent trihydroxycyclohexane-1,2-dione (THcHDO) dehydratase